MATAFELPPEEWDFRNIPVAEQYAATIYEYVRESPYCSEIVKWQKQKILGLSPFFTDEVAERYTPYFKERTSVREAIRIAYREISGPAMTLDSAGVELPSQADFFGWLGACTGQKREPSIIASRIDGFPRPWINVRSTPGGRDFERFCSARVRLLPSVMFVEPEDCFEEMFDEERRRHVRHVKLWIDPKRPIKVLQRDFLKIIAEMEGPAPAKRGRKGRDDFLKYLSAYRLHRAGIQWDKVLEVFQKPKQTKMPEGLDKTIPDFASKQIWDRAVNDVTGWLGGDFFPLIDQAFRPD